MRNYKTDLANVDGNFPNMVAKNKSSEAPRGGTGLHCDWLNDIWGFFQRALAAVGATPSGTNESSTMSQVWDSLLDSFWPAGNYFAMAGASVPTAARLLVCDGTAVPSATYPRLVDARYCGNASNPTAPAFYKCTDPANPNTSRSTSGTYFVLPDLQGEFLRGYDPDAGTDPYGATKVFGQKYAAVIADHKHVGLYTSTNGSNECKMATSSLEGTGQTVHDVRQGGDNTMYTGAVTDANIVAADRENSPKHQIACWAISY